MKQIIFGQIYFHINSFHKLSNTPLKNHSCIDMQGEGVKNPVNSQNCGVPKWQQLKTLDP